ncbi:MAG: InlB B-repeat-containing protein [Alphaproteobacteria bacterium]|nr:InlB B-repeat-containing protein [Alphaproteobacteria bacterium]
MSRILRFFALVAVVLFSVNAFAGDPYGSCSAKKVYTKCADEGYVVQNGECVPKSSGSCSAGQYLDGSECKSCPSTHPNSEAGASSELECYKIAELMKNGGNGTCFGKTGVNDGSITCYYGSTCALPSWNFSSCNMTNGSKIFQGWSLSDNATTGATGDFQHDTIYYAVWVTPSCNITNGTGVATTASSNKPRCNVTCNSGYGTSGTHTGSTGATSVSYTCTLASNTCSAGQYWDGSACQECTSGYYCPGGTWTGTAVQGRKSCPAGYENSEPGSVDKSDCYLTTTAGKYVETPESAETTCAENGYCPGGIDVHYGDTDGRMACTANSSSAPGSDEISDCQCNAGYGGNAGVANGTCTICAAGTYKTDSGNSSCSACTAGYYCTGGANQTACTANSSSGAGSDAISDCKCNVGYGGNAGVTNGTCTICAAGKYKISSGNTSCSTCTAGYYCTGGANRTACAANSSSGAGSDEISDCKCNAGYGGNAGETNGTCTICAAGTYKTSSGNSSCSTCTEGYYCTGGTNNQKACPTGYGNSAPGSDAQSDCYMVVPAGSYLRNPGDTSPSGCLKGSSSGQHEVYYGNVSQCSSCAPGSYTPYDGASCSVCPAGSYCTGDGQATRCPPLYPNSTAGSVAATDCYTNTLTGQYIATPRAEVVTDCQAGTSAGAHTVYYGDTSQCLVCKTNQWSGDAAGSCQTCPSGWANDGATAADHAYISSCKHTVQAGNWYNSDNSTFDTCADGTYSEAHMAGYGVSTSCESCNTGYTNNTNHTACVAIKYTVKYNANGATSGSTASSSHEYGVAKTLTANGFTRTGYTFAGWATSASDDVVYTNQQSVINLESTQGATVNLYAKWTANDASIFLWGGSYTTAGTTTVYATYDTNVYLDSNRSQAMTTSANNITKPTRNGYTFGGYYSESDGTGTEYIDANGYITSAGLSAGKKCVSSPSCTWYAKWIQDCYKITLDNTTNGGTGGTTVLYKPYNSNLWYSDSSCSTQVTTITVPTKTNAVYRQHTNSTSPGGGSLYISFGNLVATTVTGPITLYAHYTCDENWRGSGASISGTCTGTQLSIRFDANGGTGGQTDDVTATYGSQMPAISTTPPTRTGYTFNGWYDAQTGGTQYYTATGASARTCDKTATTWLYARWTAIPYTVSFDANGGTGGQTDDVTATYGSQMPTISTTKPTRTGYSFNGWYDAETGGTQYYTATGASARLWNKTANTTLYAHWTANTYTVSFDANGGNGGQTNSVTATYGSPMPTISTTKPTRTGYTFDGWYDAETGGTQYYTATGVSARTWDKTDNTTLYARWTAGNYVINLSPSTTTTLGTHTLYTTYDTNVYLDSNRSQAMTTSANNITKPTRNGYTFGGYYSESGGTGTEYIDVDGYITPAGLSAGKECASTFGCTWHAKWIQDCYQITLDNTANGGTGGTTVLYKTYNSNLWYSDSSCSTQVTTITVPTKTNAVYGSHFTSESGGGTQYISDSGSLLSKTVTGPITLYARYNCDANWRGSGTTISGTCTGTQSTVSFNANGGTGGQMNNVTATYGSSMPAISTTKPTRTGYTFNGWYDAETGGTQYYNANGASARTWDKTANTTLYARWTANNYGIRLSPGSFNSQGTLVLYTTYGTNVYLDSNRSQAMTTGGNPITKPTWYAHTFGGYYSESGGTGTEYIDADGYITSDGLSAAKECLDSCEWYAKWTANTYTVKYNANGGTGGTTASSSHQYGVAKTLTANGFTRTGYTFAGWATSSSGAVKYTDQQSVINLASTQGATINLYAKWTGNTYTVSFDANGGTGGQTDNVTAMYGSRMPTISTTPPTRTGYTFNGWYDAQTGGTKYYTAAGASARNWNKTDNTTLYARWTANTYTVSFNANGGTGGQTDDVTATYGSQMPTISTTAPTRTGYTFNGWYDAETGGTQYYTAAGASARTWDKAENTMLYAQWTANTYKCTSGQYLNVTSCETCTAGYYCPSSSVTYTYNGSVQGRTECGGGKYSSAGATSCSNITAGCYGTSASSSCPAVCAANTYSNAGASSCSSCPTDYKNSGDTAASHAGSASCIITVSGGYYIGTAGDNSSNWDKCAGGTYKASHTVAYGSTSSCETCEAGYYCPAGASGQTACGGNTKYSSSGASSCSTVSDGYYSTGGTSTTRTGQTKCEAGNYCSGGVKTECGGGKYSSDGSTSCSNITAGCYGTSASSSCPAVCAANTYSNAGASSCSSCPTGYKNSGDTAASHAGSASCIITVSGGYYIGTAGDNSSNWDKCAGGTYKASHTVAYGSTSSCETCEAGYYCPAGASGQTACGGGKYSSDGATSCSNITAGCYGTSATTACPAKCVAGKYSAAGAASCTDCGGGKYSSEGSSSCSNITAGCYGTSASSSCPAVCARNTYSDAGASSCSSCPTEYKNSGNTAASHAGSASCKISVAGGKYVGTENSATLSTCQAGYYKEAHSVAYGSTSSCTACGAVNKYSSSGASSCSTVSDGYYTTGGTTATRTGQSKCASGTYCTGGEQKTCPTGYDASAAGSVAAAECYMSVAATKYVAEANDASATACGTGTYKAAHTVYYGDTSTCNSCPTGYDDGAAVATQAECIISVAGGKYVGTENSATLSTCAGGTYKAAHSVAYGSTSSCETCGTGYYCPAGSDTQRLCADLGGGLYSESGEGSDATDDCYATVPATKYLSSTTSTSFTTCTAGYYCPGKKLYYANTGGRTACGGGKYSEAGSDASSDCKKISAGCYGTSASSSCPAVCGTNTYSDAGASSCSSCPTDYKNSGDTAASHAGSESCIITVSGGYYIGTAGDNSSNWDECAGGTYKASHTVAYGSTSSCETCGTGYYCPAGADGQSLCADLGGGLYSESGEGSDATDDCYATVPATKYLSSSTSTSFTTCTAGYYCPGKTLYYASTGGRTACGGGKYSEEGSDASSDCKSISAGCYGSSASSACPNTCSSGSYSTGGAYGCTICGNKPANSSYTDATGNTSADCPWTCDEGYNQTSDNQCGQLCGGGITQLHLENGTSIPLYSSSRTSPAINVKVNDTVCFGSLTPGLGTTGTLNVKVGSTTYHAIN